ncbi:MAG TPA: NAD-dependent epimerase/dehydratase family protein [Candidatus Bilamarchaeum sp.]|nr:NAD-dependent epimerase/dehydratase family protein [Candidatus Bilamarchaeum sp.]
MGLAVVTGGAGFIGSHLSLKLAEAGHEVRIYDNYSAGGSPLLKENESCFRIYRADILDAGQLGEALEGADYVFHNAAIRSIPRSTMDPLGTSRVNIQGTLNVLECARRNEVKRVILASSSSVYGNSAKIPFSESEKTEPGSFYSASKVANEYHASLYAGLYGLDTISLRYFNVFGPAQDGSGPFSTVIPKFICAMMAGKRPVIEGDGNQARDFTYVGNVVHANLLAMKAGKECAGKAFNVGQGERTTVNAVVEKLNSLLGSSILPLYAPARPADMAHTQADLSLSGKMLGYRPETSFDAGLAATARWFLDNRG